LSLDTETYAAFADELTKIGIAKTLGKWVGRGWRDIATLGGEAPKRRLGGLLAPKVVRGGGWLGKQDTWRRNIPIGPKSIFTGLTAAAAPGALSKEDPLGQERSRTERSVGLGADILGGLAGAGAALSLPGTRFRLARSLVGGIGGSLLGGRIATTPWRRARERASQPVLTGRERQELMQHGTR